MKTAVCPVERGRGVRNGAVRLKIQTFQAKLRGFAPEGFQRAIGKPFGGAEVAEPQTQKSQLFLVKLLYGMFGISLTAPLCALESILHGRQTETARSSAPSGNASLPDGFFFDRFAIGNDGGLTAIPLPEGHCPSDSLPRFALMARYSERISASGNRGASAASDSRAPRRGSPRSRCPSP